MSIVPPDITGRPVCFVIGPIGQSGTENRKHADLLLHAVIRHVLEADEFGYRVKRADEDADPGMIGDRVVSDIIRAELVVADLTGLNPNAFYELGIRHSTLMPTIHVAKAGTELPFDNISHRTIFVDLTDWHSIESGRARLSESIRAIRTPGFQVSNPITQANASFQMRASSDPRDRVIAELHERVSSFEAQLREIVANQMTPGPIGRAGNFARRERIRRNDDSLSIDTRPILGDEGGKYDIHLSEHEDIQSLLNDIFFQLTKDGNKARIAPYKYNDQWILEDAETGRQFTDVISNPMGEAGDSRSVGAIGIKPGMLLLTKRVSRPLRS